MAALPRNLPKKYGFLGEISVLPLLVSTGLRYYGQTEIKGPKNNNVIMQMAADLVQAGYLAKGEYYSDDAVPWCGLFMAAMCLYAGKPVQPKPLWARNWVQWGSATDTARLGDVLVFSRASGGHVGICIAEDDTRYYVLGGNQSDQVNISPIDKARCIAVRAAPFNTAMPDSYRKYVINSTGEVSSTNEE